MGNYVPLQTCKKFFTSEVKGVTYRPDPYMGLS